jgi:hypothetical protein
MKTTLSHIVAIIGMLLLVSAQTGTLMSADALRIAVSITNPIKKTLKIVQYNTDGTLVGDLVSLSNVNEQIEFALRDLTHHKGELYCVFGTFNPKVLRLTQAKTQMFDHPGWSYVNSRRYGAITSYGDHLYAADMWTAREGNSTGLIRFTFNHKKQENIVARFADTASIADVTATSSGKLIIVDEFGRLICMDHANNDNTARLHVVDPEPLSHIPNTKYHVTCATAFNDGTIVYGTMQNSVIVEKPQGGFDTHIFNGIINDIDQVGTSSTVVVCETGSGIFHILDISNGACINVRYADPMESPGAFACVYSHEESADFIGPPQPKSVPKKLTPPKPGRKKSGNGIVTQR